ncbi:hypothetical protein EVA_15831 [gut metagenome]|uniref:Uncharacterized protein n=1 Tax=gut metagenome TaxID=749906 RepID=J9G2Q1_9ZZZZ
MFSSIHLFAFSGDFFQPDAQVDTNSTIDVPFPAIAFSKALRSAFFAFFTAAAVWTLWRVTRHVPSSCANRSQIFRG